MATPRKTRTKVGVIGLGIIGTRVAANLRGAGYQVYVWSRSPHSSPNFLGSVVEVADLCDVIQIFVSDDAALLEVVRTIAAALSPRHLLTSHATVAPATVRQAASIVEGMGARFLDAPFTGSKAAAQNRQLVYYVGGDESLLEEVRPVLEVTSKKILHVGRVGDAMVLKIATNMLTASTVQTLAEMLALVRAAGIDEKMLVEALENNASRSGTSDLKLPSMIAENFEPNFSLKHMLKDVRLAIGTAASFKIPLPLADTAAHILSGSMEHGWGDMDFSVVAKNYDTLLPLRPAPKPPVAFSEPPVTAVAPDPSHTESAVLPPLPIPPAAESTPPDAASTPPTAPRSRRRSTPVKPAPIGGAAPGHREPKKNTLRVIRDFFKPAQS